MGFPDNLPGKSDASSPENQDAAATRKEDNRAGTRIHRLVQGRIETGRLAGGRFLIRDISERGLGGRCEEPLCKGSFRKGEKVAIMLPNALRVEASVAWAKGHLFGLVFDQPIDPSAIIVDANASARRPYVVPATFRAATNYRRPGFGHK
jgi:hypothetical protein